MSFVLLGILNSQAAGVASPFRLQTLGSTGDDRGNAITVDSSSNVIAVGQTDSTGAGNDDVLIVQYDSSGNIQWQRTLGGANNEEASTVAVDSSDNIYIGGETQSAGAGGIDALLAKYNSSGTIQWQRVLGDTSTEECKGVAIDSSGNVYITGFSFSQGAGGQDFIIAKYNSSGTLQFQRTLGGGNNDIGYGIAIDSSDNFYVVGHTNDAGGDRDFLLAKYNSSGTIQWQRALEGANRDDARDIAIDSADNIYFIGHTESAGTGRNFFLAKYNSSGTLQWQRILGGANTDQGLGVAIDSSDDIYILGEAESVTATEVMVIAKYNSSGTIQWQRYLDGGARDLPRKIAIDNDDNVNITGLTSSAGEGSFDLLAAVLPNDGSLTGSYVLDGVTFTYATSSLTAATSSLTSSASSFTDQSASFTDSSSSLTSSSASLTEHRVNL